MRTGIVIVPSDLTMPTPFKETNVVVKEGPRYLPDL